MKSVSALNDSYQFILSELIKDLFTKTSTLDKINITELFNVLENKTFQFDMKKSDSSFPTQLFESSNLDINNCVSNCSNNGLCKLNKNGLFECLCNSNFTGSKCESD